MEQQNKPQYLVPTSTVVEVTTESIICASQHDYIYGGLDEE